ncbi:MAG TPA: hypothetical protein VFO31_09775 [Vicinamibacterales bacterium]|nr:hypothetical protein [Vicinamibacterales bacterium]
MSIGADWRGSMMANSARDPYWQAAVRREMLDHPKAQAAIEDECSICHMPMTTFAARAAGAKGRILDHLPIGQSDEPDAALAADGVSCTVCHQISADGLGSPATFTGKYVIDVKTTGVKRSIFGPFAVDAGRARVMQSAGRFTPTESTHVQKSELCASCHTLFTHALAADGSDAGRLPEQTPYLEWQQSEYATKASCQTCHMPVVAGQMPIAAVLGQPREGYSRHTFLGGNFFMLRMLSRYRDELGVRALPRELDSAIARTVNHLQQATARVVLTTARTGDRLDVDVDVLNEAGHKFPTGYPSRRAWLHLTVTDAAGRVIFESGAFQPDGRVSGNDNDADAGRFEPHHTQITRADQVQIYESVMLDSRGTVTTGLLSGARYAKDNRLLPRGFNKTAAPADVAVHGDAASDADFAAGEDRVRYMVTTGGATGPFNVTARLWFQPIGFRWAENLRAYDAPEPKRFLRYFDSMASASAMVVAEARSVIR